MKKLLILLCLLLAGLLLLPSCASLRQRGSAEGEADDRGWVFKLCVEVPIGKLFGKKEAAPVAAPVPVDTGK